MHADKAKDFVKDLYICNSEIWHIYLSDKKLPYSITCKKIITKKSVFVNQFLCSINADFLIIEKQPAFSRGERFHIECPLQIFAVLAYATIVCGRKIGYSGIQVIGSKGKHFHLIVDECLKVFKLNGPVFGPARLKHPHQSWLPHIFSAVEDLVKWFFQPEWQTPASSGILR